MRALADAARVGPSRSASASRRGRDSSSTGVRAAQAKRRGLDAFLRKYDLSSQEGVILMCLAEALLRIPDDATADKLIADKIAGGRLGVASRRRRVAVRECIDLGSDAHRAHRAAERRGSARSARLRGAHRRTHRRAGAARRVPAGHAHHGPSVRHGPHDRGGARALAQRGESRVPAFVRHARRGGADARRCRALSRGLSQGDRGRRSAPCNGAADRGVRRASPSSCPRCSRATNSLSVARVLDGARAAAARARDRRRAPATSR